MGKKPRSHYVVHLDQPIAEESVNTTPDLISDFPDELLNRIVSFLPILSAAQTRLLSTRWRDLYTKQHKHKSITITTTTLLGTIPSPPCKSSTDWARFLNHPFKLEFKSRDSQRLFVATLSSCHTKLHLDFSNGDLLDHNVSLWHACFKPLLTYLPPKANLLVSKIRLTSVGHVYAEVVSSMLSIIEPQCSIEISKAEHLSEISVFGHTKIKDVTIIDCDAVKSIHVFADILSFRCRGRCPSVFIIAACWFSDLMLDFREGPVVTRQECAPLEFHWSKPLEFLWCPSLVKLTRSLTMCQWTFEVLMRPALYEYQFPQLNELWWIDDSMKEENVNSLIAFLKVCPNLWNIFVTIDPKCYHLPSEKTDTSQPCTNKQSCSLCLPLVQVNDFKPLRYLRVVKIDGFEHDEEVMLLADRIFNLASREIEVVATSRDSRTRRLVKSGPDQAWSFVDETDNDMLNLKHEHMGI